GEDVEALHRLGPRRRVHAPRPARLRHVGPDRVLAVPVPVALGECREALDVLRLERPGDALALEVLGVVLQLAVEAALVPHRVDEGLDAPELAARVDAVQRERRAAAARAAARKGEVPGDLARRLRIALLDLRERHADDEIGVLAGGLVLQPAGRVVELVLALVRGGQVPELLRRSEERRVGKECRARWEAGRLTEKDKRRITSMAK